MRLHIIISCNDRFVNFQTICQQRPQFIRRQDNLNVPNNRILIGYAIFIDKGHMMIMEDLTRFWGGKVQKFIHHFLICKINLTIKLTPYLQGHKKLHG